MALFAFYANAMQAQGITHYQVFFGTATVDNSDMAIIRKYEQAGQGFYIGIGFNSLETKIIAAKTVKVQAIPWADIVKQYAGTPYIKAIQAAQSQDTALQDSGIIHGYPKEKGITLTIDLCPSHKPLDRVIFTSLLREFSKTEQPVPVALSITGRFMLTHSADIEWLREMATSGQLKITWVNHTYNHHFNPKVPLKNNFLLEPGTDLNFEILGTEVALLEKGLLFSSFFRFPGLVSSPQLIGKITSYGLIPIGSDAWLAKGQQAHDGTIVLIHGNGNEPLGIRDFISLLQKEKEQVLNKEWILYDLRDSVEDEFQN